jgi:RecA-family ATPase
MKKIENAFTYAKGRPGRKRAIMPEYRRTLTPNFWYVDRQQVVHFLGANGNSNVSEAAINDMLSNIYPEPEVQDDYDDGPLTAAELAHGEFPRAEHLWQNFLLKDHPNSIDGDGGIGKTQVLIQIAVAVAAGKPLFGHETTQQPVLLVLCEDTYGETKYRLLSACQDLGVNLAELPIEIWCRPGDDSVLAVVDDNGSWQPSGFYDSLVGRLKKTGPCFLGLDTISDIAVLDENKRLPMNTLAKKVLGGLCKDFESTILITRHPSKASMNDGTYYSGSTAGNAAFRNRLLLAKKNDGALILNVVKSNYGLVGEEELFHSGSVFQNIGAVERVDREKIELAAVLQTVSDLRANGITVVKSHGNGHKPKDIATILKKGILPEITWQAVRDHLSTLEQNGEIHWMSAISGKNGRSATYEIGPRPVEQNA